MNNSTFSYKSCESVARQLTLKQCQEEGYEFIALHTYHDQNGKPLYWRIRLRHPVTKHKWIRPLHRDINNRYHLSEPPILNGKLKPLYGLHLLTEHPTARVLIVEGEYPADIANQFFNQQNVGHELIAITSGSATSADTSDWTPLVKRNCLIWPDKDEVGFRYAEQVRIKLVSIDCSIEVFDAKKLDLSEGGDCVDWLEGKPSATITDLLSLPRLNPMLTSPISTEDDIIMRLASLSRLNMIESELLNPKY